MNTSRNTVDLSRYPALTSTVSFSCELGLVAVGNLIISVSQLYVQTQNEEERQLFDLLSCMLEYDVSRRITLEEALWHPFFSPLRTQKQQQCS